MILISHRGHINGINREQENHPDYLRQALNLGYHIETDLWVMEGGKLFLGHDGPTHPITESFFKDFDSTKMIYHAKNDQALLFLSQQKDLHYYWHEDDDYTLTSKGLIWVHCFNGKLLPGSICVLPEVRKDNLGLENCAGICSDFVEKYK